MHKQVVCNKAEKCPNFSVCIHAVPHDPVVLSKDKYYSDKCYEYTTACLLEGKSLLSKCVPVEDK